MTRNAAPEKLDDGEREVDPDDSPAEDEDESESKGADGPARGARAGCSPGSRRSSPCSSSVRPGRVTSTTGS
ncbi:hypothetical protein SHKM778_85170 [Streptomyces sp. KM77-8]|uniref:Uncharacterized protein n=1 Tax=Streptomyces haneummycinicus TaxID=3074435 RepID=A0AAT9HY12_9ACTN